MKAPSPKRKRNRKHPVQVYFSAEELDDLGALARSRGESVSQVIRAMCSRAAARMRASAPKTMKADPRQLRLA